MMSNLALNKPHTGEEIKLWCTTNQLVSTVAREIFINYFEDNEVNPNPKILYFIDKENRRLVRDKQRCPRNPKLKNKELEYYVNNNKSIVGEDLIKLINNEMDNKPSEEFEKFYDEVITSSKYRPRDGVYYFIKFNTYGRYWLKRDNEKSPRLD